MSWLDIKSLTQMKKLRDMFNVKTFIETGTWKGNGAQAQSANFETVLTIEVVPEYYWKAKKYLYRYPNVFPILGNSPDVLRKLKPSLKNTGTTMFFLDAHFYDASLPQEDRWVLLKELRAMKGWYDSIITIHDFNCNGLGGLCYDGQPLNFDFVRDSLLSVNPSFHFYFNELSGTDILTREKVLAGKVPPLVLDEEVSETLDFVWSKPETHHRSSRGILYAVPAPLDLTQFELVTTN